MLKINNIYHTIDKIEEYLEKLINEYEIDVIIEIREKDIGSPNSQIEK